MDGWFGFSLAADDDDDGDHHVIMLLQCCAGGTMMCNAICCGDGWLVGVMVSPLFSSLTGTLDGMGGKREEC